MAGLHFRTLLFCSTVLLGSVVLPVGSSAGPWRKATSVDRLACEIDRLECHIETFGTIVAKQPDVWGQSRLTKYRQDFEFIMAQRKDKFQETINASIARSDQAFLASAMALQSASSGTAPPNASTMIGDPNAAGQQIITRTAPFQIKGGSTEGQGIALEPTVVLDQAARYLDHLNELRRVNDGDDTADSPGYGLHLVRIPISVLPGKKTRAGYGAEVTLSIQPYLSDELLPATYRNLVVNDVIDLLALGITKVLNELSPEELNQIDQLFRELYDGKAPEDNADDVRMSTSRLAPELEAQIASGLELTPQETRLQYESKFKPLKDLDRKAIDRVAIQRFQANVRQRRSRQALSSTQVSDVFGSGGVVLGHVVLDANRTLRNQSSSTRIHMLDVEGFLKSELEAAYDFLSQPEALPLWERHCTTQLNSAIRLRSRKSGDGNTTHPQPSIWSLRRAFFDDLKQNYAGAAHTTTASLAWAILVEAALLNERLVEDIRETSTATNCSCVITDWMPFYLPSPPPEARLAFNQYVRCRWPVHVFALDPVTQDQNVADSFSRRREMQLALSLAFSSGQIGANSFTRFARRLELDMETIALNRTMVGFSHGNETFGWRFYPRVQTPPTESNMTVVFRDLLWGGPSRDAEIRTNRLEPGIRECVALVVMPSFVPYVVMDVRSNWFSLVNPQKKVLNLQEAATLSESVQTLHANTEACMQDADRYRDGDVHRLLRAAEQLEARLPLQSTYVQVPFENTLGGFEMFNTGVTDLAPELHGFYGEPGVTAGQATEVFLVGDHFNVHETKVIAGTKLAASELLSRQVMRITISGDARISNGFVDVQVATPYGVSRPLSIPVVDATGPATVAAAIASHEQEQHRNRYTWGEPAIDANVSFDAEGRIAGICLQHSPVTVQDVSDIPFPVVDVDLACWVNIQKPDGTSSRIPNVVVGPIRTAFSGGRLVLPSTDCRGPLADALLRALKGDSSQPPFVAADGIVALELEGFLRAVEGRSDSNPGTSDGLPVIKIDRSLNIRLRPCPSVPCAPTISIPSPFDASPRVAPPSREPVPLPPEPAAERNSLRGSVRSKNVESAATDGRKPQTPGSRPLRPKTGFDSNIVNFDVTAAKPTEMLPPPGARTAPARQNQHEGPSIGKRPLDRPRIVPVQHLVPERE